MSSEINNAKIADLCTQRIRALKTLPAKTQIALGGVLYKVTAVIAIYQAILDNQAALIKSRAQVAADLAARRLAETKREAIEFGLKVWVLNHLGADSNAASEFGYAAPKRAAKSAEAVANAVKLAKATREARHTMGKRAKLKIKGTLDVPTAPAAPAIPTPPTLPAVVATPTSSTPVVQANGAQASPPNGGTSQAN